ncbi:MAG: ATP-grasp domain-containing protein [Myxococcales bacterium]|nr:ATP-grasp domain-containing protein [Myxococcales bacterium]
MARVLLISDEEAKGLLWCAASGGHEVFVTGVRERNPTVSLSTKAKKFFPLPETASFTNEAGFPALATTIVDLARRLEVDVIVPSSFESLKFAIMERDCLTEAAPLVPLATMDKVQLLDDKYSFYRFCCEHGFPHPPSCLLESAADLAKPELSELIYPVLTKPILGVAEQGIEKFDTREALERRVAAAPGSFFPDLAQEWFDGEDIDFNGYALDGEVAVSSVMRTTRYESHGGRGPEVRFTDFVAHPEVSRLGIELVKKSQFTGPLNVDLRIRYSDEKVFFIEVNPRFWGRSMACLIDGLNFIDAGIQLTRDRQWRNQSRCDGTHWASSIVPLLRDAARGDVTARSHLRRLSPVQLQFQLHNRSLELLAKLRGVAPIL